METNLDLELLWVFKPFEIEGDFEWEREQEIDSYNDILCDLSRDKTWDDRDLLFLDLSPSANFYFLFFIEGDLLDVLILLLFYLAWILMFLLFCLLIRLFKLFWLF